MSIAVSELRSAGQFRSLGAFSRPDRASGIFDAMKAAEPFWRRLEKDTGLSTAYQRFDFLAAWQQHVGSRSRIEPSIVIGFDGDGEPVFLWPFGRMRKGPLTIVRFLGSKHANFNLGLWRRDILPSIGEHEIRCIFEQIKRRRSRRIMQSTLSWDGAGTHSRCCHTRLSVDMSACLSLREQEPHG